MRRHGRQLLPHPFLLPHRQIDAFAGSCTTESETILRLPIHAQLSVVKQGGPLALLRVYVDGVDTGGKSRKVAKKVFVFSWTPVDQTHSVAARRIITLLLDNRCCKSCGCNGRCTRNAVWKVCCWSWAALRSGYHPRQGPFREELTGIWAALAGKPLNICGEVAHMGADWEGFSDMCGLRRWNHSTAPCAWCTTPLCDMHNYALEYETLTKEHWDAAKAATQVIVRVSPENAGAIQASLQPDLRKTGSLGRALTSNVGAVLKTGDRLEKIEGMRDICSDVSTLPVGCELQFFRPHDDARLRFWFPLVFDTDYGDPILNPANMLGDILHTVDAGCAQYCGGEVFKLFFEHAVPVLRVAPHANKTVVEKRCMNIINDNLQTWYMAAESSPFRG